MHITEYFPPARKIVPLRAQEHTEKYPHLDNYLGEQMHRDNSQQVFL